MNSAIKSPIRRTLYVIVPFIVVLLFSTFVFGAHTSFPITITSPVETTSGNIKLKNVTKHFSGTIDLNADGCNVRFSGHDGTLICINSISEAGYDQRIVGTGTIAIPVRGVVEQGIVYIDATGTWNVTPKKEILLFNGKIGGGGPDFVFTGSFKSTFVYSSGD